MDVSDNFTNRPVLPTSQFYEPANFTNQKVLTAMSPQPAPPKACIFDVFGTVVDWRGSVSRICAEFFATRNITLDSIAFAEYWRGQYDPAMERVRAGNRGYVPLDELHLENLQATLDHFGLGDRFTADELWQLNSAWEQLDPWPNAVAGLMALKQHTIIAPCSNGSIALMTRLARHANLPWDCVLGADIARNYKPHEDVYRACCAALRLQPQEVMMVAAHNADLEAAQRCGLQTAFIPRPVEYGANQAKDLSPTGDWDRIITGFADLAHRP